MEEDFFPVGEYGHSPSSISIKVRLLDCPSPPLALAMCGIYYNLTIRHLDTLPEGWTNPQQKTR